MPVRRTNRRGQGKSFPTPAVPAELTITSDEHYYNLNALLLEIIPIGSDLIPPSGYYGDRILFTPFNRALRGARGEFMAATLYEIVTP